MRKFAIAAVAALWATSADAAHVSFGNGFGLSISGQLPGSAAASGRAMGFSAFPSVHNAVHQWLLGVNAGTGQGLGLFIGRPSTTPPVTNVASPSPTAMPLPGGLALLVGGLGMLYLGRRMCGQPKPA